MKHLNGNHVLGLLRSSKASSEVAAMLGITERCANKLRQKPKTDGDDCLINKNKGRQREWKTDKETEGRIITLCSGKCNGFNFTHFLEKPNKQERIKIGYRPLYRILTSSGFISPKAQKKKKRDNIHPLRDRRKNFGELLQIDASIHQWFKASGLKYALHGAVDDATGTIMGLCFDDEETLSGYHHMLEKMMLIHGGPKAFCTDERTVFAYNRLSDKDKTIENNANIQFKRRCSQLGVEITTTSVPQAKGRIERLWGTLRSRLFNGLALDDITSIEDANRFLPKFEKGFNEEFAFDPKDFDNSFTPWNKTKEEELGYYLSTQYARVAGNGSSFSLNCNKYCLVDGKHKALAIPPKTKVNAFKTLNENIIAVYNGKYCETKLAISVGNHKTKPMKFKVETKPEWKPSPNHPWRRHAVSCR